MGPILFGDDIHLVVLEGCTLGSLNVCLTDVSTIL